MGLTVFVVYIVDILPIDISFTIMYVLVLGVSIIFACKSNYTEVQAQRFKLLLVEINFWLPCVYINVLIFESFKYWLLYVYSLVKGLVLARPLAEAGR